MIYGFEKVAPRTTCSYPLCRNVLAVLSAGFIVASPSYAGDLTFGQLNDYSSSGETVMDPLPGSGVFFPGTMLSPGVISSSGPTEMHMGDGVSATTTPLTACPEDADCEDPVAKIGVKGDHDGLITGFGDTHQFLAD